MDDRNFEPVTTSFDETWPRYSYSPLTRWVLAFGAWIHGRRIKRAHEQSGSQSNSTLNVSRQLAP